MDAQMKALTLAVVVAAALCQPARAGDLEGPARFCGYSPIIDLRPGEKITTLDGGIHGGSFRWEGAFGALEVRGIGWAGRPKGRIVEAATDKQPARFTQRRVEGRYEIAIWNGRQGAAYLSSAKPLTPAQREAIGRVVLFQEGETPEGCQLRTIFVWE